MSSNRIPSPGKTQESKPVAAKNEAEEIKIPSEIEVVALRPGFRKKVRIQEGQRFSVASLEEVGSWMKIVDPKLAKYHKEMLAEKRKAELEEEKKAGK